MRSKETSDALKRHRKTFHLARHDPELWEQERSTTLSDSLHNAQERASEAEKVAETNKKLLECGEQEVSSVTA